MAGKEALFKVKIHDIKARELPTIDDDFASEVSEFDTLEEYKKSIREKLEARAAEQVKTETENAVIEKVVEGCTVEVPAAMINDQADRMMQDFAQRLQYQGMDFGTYLQYTNATPEAFKENMKPQAERQIKTTLVLEAIAKAENVDVTDEEVNDRIVEMAKQYNMEADKLKSLMQDADMDGIREELAMNKVIDMLVNKAKITKPRAKKAAPKAEGEDAKAEEAKDAE